MLAPIALFVYNRPNHTQRTIETLAENELAKESTIYIFSDGKKEKDNSENVDKTRKYIESIKDKGYFKNVILVISKDNNGLANSIISGVTSILENHEKVIVMEDDLISSKYFLRFMNDSLNFFERFDDIWSISGYTIPIKIPKLYTDSLFISYRSSSWGWATWKKNWDKVDWTVSDYNTFKNNRQSRKLFNRGGKDLSYLLDDQMNGKVDSWAIRWYYSQFLNNKFTIYPTQSFIKNIGLDGSGTHSGVNKKYHVEINEGFSQYNIEFKRPVFNKELTKRFKNYYMSYKGLLFRKIRQYYYSIKKVK